MVRFEGIQWDKSKVQRKGESRFWEFLVHNRRLIELLSNQALHFKGASESLRNPYLCNESAQMDVSSGGSGAQQSRGSTAVKLMDARVVSLNGNQNTTPIHPGGCGCKVNHATNGRIIL
jgi:hypothetical protein